jgi:hypothetical protein
MKSVSNGFLILKFRVDVGVGNLILRVNIMEKVLKTMTLERIWR